MACAATPFSNLLDVGPIDQSKPPSVKELQVPESDEGIRVVGLHAIVGGKIDEQSDANVYVLVNPLSNPATRNVWWVQRKVERDGDKFRCHCQFGEGQQGAGEYFAILALASKQGFDVGDQLKDVPKDAKYTKLKIVKRAD